MTPASVRCLTRSPADRAAGIRRVQSSSLAAQVLRSPDLLRGGLVIFLLAGIGAAASAAFPPRQRARGHAGRLPGLARRSVDVLGSVA
jgi:hypothetical protein